MEIYLEKNFSIYDFGFLHDGLRGANLRALLNAHEAGVGNAALYIGFQYYTKEELDFERALEWFKVAGSQKNISAIAAHRWMAKMYMEGAGAEVDYDRSFLHNEIYLTLYFRLWPGLDHDKLDLSDAKLRVYENLKDQIRSHLSTISEKKLILEAKIFCQDFKVIEQEPRIPLPDFLKKRS